ILPHDAPLEDAADDALLPPHLPRLQLSIGGQARQLGAGAGAARRAIVRLARTQHEIPAVVARVPRPAEQLHVIAPLSVCSGNALARQFLANLPGEVGQLVDARQLQLLSVLANEEEPVAAPRHVARDRAVPQQLDAHAGGAAPARDVLDRDTPAAVP